MKTKPNKPKRPSPPAKPLSAKPARVRRPPAHQTPPPVPETPQERMNRVFQDVRGFMQRQGEDPDRRLRILLMTMHVFVDWDALRGQPMSALLTDRERKFLEAIAIVGETHSAAISLLTYREAGLEITG